MKRDGATFYPLADGTTKLAITFGGQSLSVPVKVSQATVLTQLSFRLDVMPVFMRAGCNTGSCHGAARGKDGFRISLFGFDPEGDHYRLTREMVGRRINLAVPSDSTLLEKAIGAVQHTGGKRFEPSSELYQTLHHWIEMGASNDDVSKLPKPVGIGSVPEFRRARRKRFNPADDRSSPLLGRHRPRRDKSGCIPLEQRHLGGRQPPTVWSPPATVARRSSWPGLPPSPSARSSLCCPGG